MDRYTELSEDTIKDFYDVFNKKSFPIDIKFQFIGDYKQKTIIKISRIPEDISFILDKEVKIIMNEELMDVFDEESIQILIEQELDKLECNLETGKIKLRKTDLNTFSSIVNKYGVEKVAKANQVEDLYQEQKADGQTADLI
jgi:hypothetical protein